jgi:hypothetical protein
MRAEHVLHTAIEPILQQLDVDCAPNSVPQLDGHTPKL